MSTRNRVRQLMQMDTRYRENDMLLWLKLAEEEGFELNVKQKLQFLGLPNMEMVARRRREFSKEFPASEAVTDRRYRHYKQMTDEFSKQGWLFRMLKKRRVF